MILIFKIKLLYLWSFSFYPIYEGYVTGSLALSRRRLKSSGIVCRVLVGMELLMTAGLDSVFSGTRYDSGGLDAAAGRFQA